MLKTCLRNFCLLKEGSNDASEISRISGNLPSIANYVMNHPTIFYAVAVRPTASAYLR